jgi:GNAT superfamily N-acetyltransferase
MHVNLFELDDDCNNKFGLFCDEIEQQSVATFQSIVNEPTLTSKKYTQGWDENNSAVTVLLDKKCNPGTEHKFSFNLVKFTLQALNSNIIWSMNLEVAYQLRGKGIGQALLNSRLAVCRKYVFKQYWCSVSADNVRQQHILTKAGFVQHNDTRIWMKVL